MKAVLRGVKGLKGLAGKESILKPSTNISSDTGSDAQPSASDVTSSGMWPDFLLGQPDKPVRVLVVDDDVHIRRVMLQQIMNDKRTLMVGQAASLREGKKLIRQLEFDVMLLDINLGDGSGLDLLDLMKSVRPQAEAVIVSVIETDDQVLKAFEMGAVGYMVKNSWFGNYVQSVLQVANGGASITPNLARRLLQRFDKTAPQQQIMPPLPDPAMDRLSEREREVLRMVATGYTSAEIGERLLITAMTVNTHIKNIYRKLQVRTRAQAVRFASLRGLF